MWLLQMMLEAINDMTLIELMGLLSANPADVFPPVEPIPTGSNETL